jgi:hypothetical protein
MRTWRGVHTAQDVGRRTWGVGRVTWVEPRVVGEWGEEGCRCRHVRYLSVGRWPRRTVFRGTLPTSISGFVHSCVVCVVRDVVREDVVGRGNSQFTFVMPGYQTTRQPGSGRTRWSRGGQNISEKVQGKGSFPPPPSHHTLTTPTFLERLTISSLRAFSWAACSAVISARGLLINLDSG